NETSDHRIRHELYEHILFPVLLAGYQRRDPWALRYLARTAQNLYHAKSLWAQVGVGEFELLKELLRLCPDDEQARTDVLAAQLRWFSHCTHEWPAGILHGMNGASVQECEEILEEIALARKLDRARQHAAFLDDVEAKVIAYRSRTPSVVQP